MSDISEKQSYSVSVVIPAYNVEKYIGRAIDSVLSQTRQADEIIVVDDGSTDNTAEVVKSYGSKVCFIHQENGGASVARNTGIEAAKSEWIAFLDADDEWLPEKLEKQIEHLKRNPDLVWTHSNYFMRSEADKTMRIAFQPAKYENLLSQEGYFEDYLDVHVGVCIRTSTAIIKKNILVEMGLFRVGQMWAQDTDLFLRIAYRQPEIGFLPDPLAVYHTGIPGSITLENRSLIRQRCDLIDLHLELAAEYGREEAFRSCALKMLRVWMTIIRDSDPRADLSEFFERFGEILPRPLVAELKLRRDFPRLSALFFREYFRVKNFFRARGKKEK